jgi:nitrogen fixation protein NifB
MPDPTRRRRSLRMLESKLDLANHPCFNPDVYRKAARIHLPVAPKCNLQCNYCDRSFDCANETRPGVSSVLLSPFQAVTYLKAVYAKMPHLTVVGIAGPGDPFANPVETMETLRLVREEFPNILLCVATNGLGLVEHIDELVELKVSHVTMTINTVNPAVGRRSIAGYASGTCLPGRAGRGATPGQAARGHGAAWQTKILVKVNTIVLPGINDGEIATVAAEVRASGAEIMNTMAMVPVAGTPFESLGEPRPEMMAAARLTAGKSFRRCPTARAAGPMPADSSAKRPRACPTRRNLPCWPASQARIAPTLPWPRARACWSTSTSAKPVAFHVFAEQNMTYVPVDVREAPDSGSGIKRWLDLADLLNDCRAVLTTGVGAAPRRVLTGSGLEVIEMEGLIEEGLSAVYGGTPIPASLRRKFSGCGLGAAAGEGAADEFADEKARCLAGGHHLARRRAGAGRGLLTTSRETGHCTRAGRGRRARAGSRNAGHGVPRKSKTSGPCLSSTARFA